MTGKAIKAKNLRSRENRDDLSYKKERRSEYWRVADPLGSRVGVSAGPPLGHARRDGWRWANVSRDLGGLLVFGDYTAWHYTSRSRRREGSKGLKFRVPHPSFLRVGFLTFPLV